MLRQEGDGWLIRSHSQFDPLVSTLLYAYMEEYADGQWDPERFRGLDFTQDYIDAVPGYLEQVVEQAELRQQQAAEETTAQAAEEPYDREAAVAYADQWIEERSGDWADYTGSGGNCQNYASQVLYAGGIPWTSRGTISGSGTMTLYPTGVWPGDAPAPGRGSSSSSTTPPAIPAMGWQLRWTLPMTPASPAT